MPQLNPDISRALSTLARGCEVIDSVMNTDFDGNRFSRALEDLQRLASELHFPIAIVGGLGAIRYGYPAATQAIDVAVGKEDLPKLLLAATRYGFKVAWESKSSWHTLTHGDVEINIVPESGKANDRSPTTIPGPKSMGVSVGLEYASIESWTELKISSGRQKDRAHVVEVLKKTDARSIEQIRLHLEKVHESYELTFRQLLQEAIDEDRQEKDRR